MVTILTIIAAVLSHLGLCGYGYHKGIQRRKAEARKEREERIYALTAPRCTCGHWFNLHKDRGQRCQKCECQHYLGPDLVLSGLWMPEPVNPTPRPGSMAAALEADRKRQAITKLEKARGDDTEKVAAAIKEAKQEWQLILQQVALPLPQSRRADVPPVEDVVEVDYDYFNVRRADGEIACRVKR